MQHKATWCMELIASSHSSTNPICSSYKQIDIKQNDMYALQS
ncbi:MAG: hypothetical protein AAGE84_14290 [Cyanobacteria bacterium P01_G01_bin.39]